MRIRALDNNLDWTFGHGKNDYKVGVEAIKQNVVTRIKSFKNDWFLDNQACIDWWNLLGSFNSSSEIKNQVYNTVAKTDGVIKIENLQMVQSEIKRVVKFTLKVKTIFDSLEDIEVEVET